MGRPVTQTIDKMTIEERADKLEIALLETIYGDRSDEVWSYDDKSFEKQLRQALIEERRIALEEAIKACTAAWVKAGNRLPHHGDCKDAIRQLINERNNQ